MVVVRSSLADRVYTKMFPRPELMLPGDELRVTPTVDCGSGKGTVVEISLAGTSQKLQALGVEYTHEIVGGEIVRSAKFIARKPGWRLRVWRSRRGELYIGYEARNFYIKATGITVLDEDLERILLAHGPEAADSKKLIDDLDAHSAKCPSGHPTATQTVDEA